MCENTMNCMGAIGAQSGLTIAWPISSTLVQSVPTTSATQSFSAQHQKHCRYFHDKYIFSLRVESCTKSFSGASHRKNPADAGAEVNISPYPGTEVPGLFSFSRAVIFISGVSCRSIGQEQLRVTQT